MSTYRLQKNSLEPLGWISPSIILFGMFLVYPIVFSIILSFFKWTGFTREPFADFVGFANYIKLVKDPLFWLSFKNTIIVVFVSVVVMTGISLISALIVYFGNFKFDNIIRAIVFFPGVISQIIIGLVFRKFLAFDGGINIFLNAIGLEKLVTPWLDNNKLAIWIVSLVIVWQWIGYIMVIFHAALQSIDHTLLEAAFIDGASLQRTVFNVVIPLIKPAIFLAAVLNFIGGFRVYAIIWILTRGGPEHASEVLTSYMYLQAFSTYGPNNMSYGATIAVVLALIVIIFAAVRIKFFSKEVA